MSRFIGVDIGAQKSIAVLDDGEIIRTSTGSIHWPTLISFHSGARYFAEEALPYASSDSTITFLNLLCGRKIEDIQEEEFTRHRKLPISASPDGLVSASVNTGDTTEEIPIQSLLGMYLSNMTKRFVEVGGSDFHTALVLSPNFDLNIEKPIRDACFIAGIDEKRVHVVDAVDAIVAAFNRKLNALLPAELAAMKEKRVVLIEVGHSQTTTVVVDVLEEVNDGKSAYVAKKCGVAHDKNLGGLDFDFVLFNYFSRICDTKYSSPVSPGGRRGIRLLNACESIRKLLSQLPESKVTVENLTDMGDVTFDLKRDDFSQICSLLLARVEANITRAIQAVADGASISLDDAKDSIVGVELFGGGSRMPAIQAMVQSILGRSIPLGGKLDDASLALGAVIVAANRLSTTLPNTEEALSHTTETPVSAFGLSPDRLLAAREQELAFQAKDALFHLLLATRNKIESFVLEMRSAPRRKHGEKIKASELTQVLDKCEEWMWDHPDASLEELENQNESLRNSIQPLCQEYFDAVEAEKIANENKLKEEAEKAAAEKSLDGEDEDHDNRKLKKGDRMRLVVKNKEEGNELFKGGNYRPAAARYHKALTHCSKFFDLSPDDEKEVQVLKVSLYLNLANCYSKLENLEQVFRNCNDALAIDGSNPKAYFRRSAAHEAKKDFDKALEDILKCQELSGAEDKLVAKSIERIKKSIQNQKDKEKKMWGKLFS